MPGPVALVADSAKDADGPVLAALGAALGTAGVGAYRVTGKAPTIQKAMRSVPPAMVVATATALPAAMAAVRKAGGTTRVQQLGLPVPGATLLDLRPWGSAHVGLADKPLA
jgi:hypothetical protein